MSRDTTTYIHTYIATQLPLKSRDTTTYIHLCVYNIYTFMCVYIHINIATQLLLKSRDTTIYTHFCVYNMYTSMCVYIHISIATQLPLKSRDTTATAPAHMPFQKIVIARQCGNKKKKINKASCSSKCKVRIE